MNFSNSKCGFIIENFEPCNENIGNFKRGLMPARNYVWASFCSKILLCNLRNRH